ncbi:Lrp/AsnC family transcriptional regulator [Ferroacidibacillus organovorans]|uniref:AsnC family transcriptional regulator n=1 Tax=Ferroacidibacillus organovorans TaxID=1765683 RepID=A0A162T9R0_9BACL|nr:Lrp/AsnC family transcriptional regulator [Ferroacidibacillus organovorans]KYP80598.1 AsnC family transcriptional regulator [Ferroacidibacillus organovorans]OAG89464.1 AsnC family transcriptional regulator [Ferroacidibacillus organovorans]OPG15860.1 AsnC family transcriptional regulator [Ferroacidibacillus organovorans]
MDSEKRIKLLHLLHENAKYTDEMLATLLDEEPAEVRAAIAEAEQSRVILGYSAIVNWDKVEGNGVTAVIDVRVTPQREVGFDAIARRIYRFSEVKSVALMSGAYDLQVVVEGSHLRDVATFVSERLATIEHVTGTATHFLLKTYKADGVIFDDREDEKRLVVAP